MKEPITEKNAPALRIQCGKIKRVLLDLVAEDKLPMDLNDLPWTVFAPAIAEMVDTLQSVADDANMALSDDWDRSDVGFEAQIELIESTLYS